VGEIQEALRRANLKPKREERDLARPDEAAREARSREFAAAVPAPTPPVARSPAPVVGLSKDRDDSWTARGLIVEGGGYAAEMLRHLAVRVRRELDARGLRTIAVVSAERAEGKTTMSCNLALALASLSSRRSVALVDLDLRNPNVGRGLKIASDPGIDDVLLGQAELAAARVEVEQPPLDVYTCRRPQREAHEILGRPTFPAAVRALERQYELVVLDTPPVLLVPDAVVVLETVKAALAVARAGRSRRRAFEALSGHLPKGRLIGCVLNEGSSPIGANQYGYYHSARPEADA
jgi:Mrp family chromosome partitioning ATPase